MSDKTNPFNIDSWLSSPIVTSTNFIKDAINRKMTDAFAERHGRVVHQYHAIDKHKGDLITNRGLKEQISRLHSGDTKNLMAPLPLVEGMPVILTRNYDVNGGIVNGTEGILKSVQYEVDQYGNRYATSCIILAPNVMCDALPYLKEKEIVALRSSVTISKRDNATRKTLSFERTQLPVVPAFAITDYKSQGKSYNHVVIDLSSCKSKQSAYVMLSRVRSLDGLIILRSFDSKQLKSSFSADLKVEMTRPQKLCKATSRSVEEDGGRSMATNANTTPPDIRLPSDSSHSQTLPLVRLCLATFFRFHCTHSFFSLYPLVHNSVECRLHLISHLHRLSLAHHPSFNLPVFPYPP